MLLLQAALAGLVLAACLYHLLAWALTRHFVRAEASRDRLGAEPSGSGAWQAARRRLWPSVSQIKPIHRLDGELREALASFLSQDYPGSHEVLLVCRESSPELVSLFEELARAQRDDEVRQIACGFKPGERGGEHHAGFHRADTGHQRGKAGLQMRPVFRLRCHHEENAAPAKRRQRRVSPRCHRARSRP